MTAESGTYLLFPAQSELWSNEIIVAEQLRRPLYKLESGDLGTIVNTVESALKDTLRRCTQWNAVLLIDEADVFLERRSADSLKRNELVSSKFYLCISRTIN